MPTRPQPWCFKEFSFLINQLTSTISPRALKSYCGDGGRRLSAKGREAATFQPAHWLLFRQPPTDELAEAQPWLPSGITGSRFSLVRVSLLWDNCGKTSTLHRICNPVGRAASRFNTKKTGTLPRAPSRNKGSLNCSCLFSPIFRYSRLQDGLQVHYIQTFRVYSNLRLWLIDIANGSPRSFQFQHDACHAPLHVLLTISRTRKTNIRLLGVPSYEERLQQGPPFLCKMHQERGFVRL